MGDLEGGNVVEDVEGQARLMEAADKALAPVFVELSRDEDWEVLLGIHDVIELIEVSGSSDARGGVVVKCRWSDPLLIATDDDTRGYLIRALIERDLGLSASDNDITEIILGPEHFAGVVEDLEILDSFEDLPDGVDVPSTEVPGTKLLKSIADAGRRAIRAITGM